MHTEYLLKIPNLNKHIGYTGNKELSELKVKSTLPEMHHNQVMKAKTEYQQQYGTSDYVYTKDPQKDWSSLQKQQA